MATVTIRNSLSLINADFSSLRADVDIIGTPTLFRVVLDGVNNDSLFWDFHGTGLTYDRNDIPTGGVFTSFGVLADGVATFNVSGVRFNAAALSRVVGTDSPADDRALIRQMFSGNDTMLGGTGNDFLNGFSGNDTVNGNNGNDGLYGDAGADRLNGGVGNDRLAGGIGIDILTGGAGADNFVFTETPIGANADRIVDFQAPGNVDHIVLDDAIFPKLHLMTAQNFHSGAAAADVNDYLIYNPDNGQLYYDRDGSGAAAKQIIAVLLNKAALTFGDFKVI